MQYYFSVKTNGFYVDQVHGKNMPEDVIKIDEQQWQEYLQALDNGKQLVLNKCKKLTLVDKPLPKLDYSELAKKLLRATDYFKLDDEWCLLTTKQQEELNDYRQALRKIDVNSTSLPTMPDLPRVNNNEIFATNYLTTT
jgi:hypothetical protein